MSKPLTPCRPGDSRRVVYSNDAWRVLREKRERAEEIMSAL